MPIMPPYIHLAGALPIHIDEEQRALARGASVSWNGSWHSVPWPNAGKMIRFRNHRPSAEIRYATERTAVHAPSPRRQQIVTLSHHHICSTPIASRA
jgi:hypothetical protein